MASLASQLENHLPADATGTVPGVDQAVIADLARLPPPEYDRVRKARADHLGVRVATLDAEVVKARKPIESSVQGAALTFEDVEPWSEPVDTTELLEEIASIVGRYVVLADEAITATALWIVYTYVHSQARISPILAIESPDMRCGKTTLLHLLDALVTRPLPVSNISAASLFRVVEKYKPTLIIDEADAFLKDNEELRGILNSGHTRGTAYVIRTVGEDHEPRSFSTWCPKAIALIGDLPRTLTDRAIVIPMRRKRPDELITKLPLDVSALLGATRRRCLRWADTEAAYLNPSPACPSGLNDRAADNWSMLLAIADTAVSGWPERARAAALALTGNGEDNEAAGVMLLSDLKTLFQDRDVGRLLSSDIVSALTLLEDRPWPDWSRGKPITVRQIARLLRPFGIQPKTLRAGAGRGKGYECAQFADAFARYLPEPIRDNVTTFEDEAPPENSIRDAEQSVTDKKPHRGHESELCHGVTDQIPQTRGGMEAMSAAVELLHGANQPVPKTPAALSGAGINPNPMDCSRKV